MKDHMCTIHVTRISDKLVPGNIELTQAGLGLLREETLVKMTVVQLLIVISSTMVGDVPLKVKHQAADMSTDIPEHVVMMEIVRKGSVSFNITSSLF